MYNEIESHQPFGPGWFRASSWCRLKPPKSTQPLGGGFTPPPFPLPMDVISVFWRCDFGVAFLPSAFRAFVAIS